MRYAIIIVLMSSTAMAHGGGLDSNGGHHDRKNGGYHYHRKSTANPPRTRTAPRTTARTTPRTLFRSDPPKPEKRPEPVRRSVTRTKSRDQIAREQYNEAVVIIENATATLQSVAQDYADTRAGKDALALLTKRAPCDGAIDEIEQSGIDEEREKAAQSKLKLAKNLMAKGAGGKRWLEEIIEEYPETEAASEAKQLLDRL